MIAQVADATEDDVRAMIDGAVAVQDEWAATPAVERAAIMRRAARIFEERIDELARLLSREQGKPVAQAVGESSTASASSTGSPRRPAGSTA